MQMRSRGNRPTHRIKNIDFHETLAPVMPTTVPSMSARAVSPRLVRGTMIVLWVLAAIAAGAGIGALIIANRTVVSTAPGLPVAKSDVKVASVAAPALVPAAAATTSDLKVTSASDVDQSQLTNFWTVAQASSLQPSDGYTALQPGFTAYGPGQGGNGTDPVVIR
jgi:hypothetical protein